MYGFLFKKCARNYSIAREVELCKNITLRQCARQLSKSIFLQDERERKIIVTKDDNY